MCADGCQVLRIKLADVVRNFSVSQMEVSWPYTVDPKNCCHSSWQVFYHSQNNLTHIPCQFISGVPTVAEQFSDQIANALVHFCKQKFTCVLFFTLSIETTCNNTQLAHSPYIFILCLYSLGLFCILVFISWSIFYIFSMFSSKYS